MSLRRRTFTVAAADAMLPGLERTLAEVSEALGRIDGAERTLAMLEVLWGADVARRANPDHEQFVRSAAVRKALAARIEDLVQREILDQGIRIPAGGFEHGLLDFPTTYRGRWVYLCWRRSEASIEYWHELHAGFAGRTRLTEQQRHEMGSASGAPPVDDSALDF